MDFIQSPVVQFIGLVLIPVIAILVAVLIYLKQKQKKKISYKILSRTSLLSVEEAIEKEVEILYKGQKIKQVQLIILQITNSGTLPVKREDFDVPLSIKFEKETKLLSATILEKEPKDLEISLDVNENSVILPPFLLNPDDNFSIKILASKVDKDLKIEGRIVGVKKIEDISLTELRRFRTIIKANFVIIPIAVIVSILIMVFLKGDEQTVAMNVLILIFITFCAGYQIIRSIFYSKTFKKQKKVKKFLKQSYYTENAETD